MTLFPRRVWEVWGRVDRRGDEACWPWLGSLNRGYGAVSFGSPPNRFKAQAHRIVWILTNGPIPDGLVVDHKCHNESDCAGGVTCEHRKCCNPAHMRLVTIAENVLAGKTIPAQFAARNTCGRGHRFIGSNLTNRSGKTFRGRECRICKNELRRKVAA